MLSDTNLFVEVVFIACYNPITAYRFFPNNKDRSEVVFYNKYHYPPDVLKAFEIQVPCGNCIGCKLAKAATWAMRCQLEAKYSTCAYFVTLTYDDGHLPIRQHVVVSESTGEVIEDKPVAVLNPDHFKQFLKNLRRYYKYHYGIEGIRFFGCGEYGSITQRPHYHLIIYNMPINDLELYEENWRGDDMFISKTLQGIWKKGNVMIGSVTFESCAYVARYNMKKVGKVKEYYENRGLVPEFVRMSRKPGIGMQYMEDHKEDIKKYNNIILKRGDKPYSFKPPRIFDKFLTEEELFERSRESEEIAKLCTLSKLRSTDLDFNSMLHVSENQKLLHASALVKEL